MPAIRKFLCFAQCAIMWIVVCLLANSPCIAQSRQAQHSESEIGNSTREARDSALKAIPFVQLTQQASTRLNSVIENSSYFRRMPVQTVACEPEILLCLARNPEILVSIWDVMGITKVTLSRVSQYQHSGSDGAGTTCNMDLVYGNESTHIYFVDGNYKGPMWAKELTGRSVVALHHKAARSKDGIHHLTVWMDVFLKVDNIGADLIVRTLSPLVSKSADSNFVESVRFLSQISQAAVNNPKGLESLISRLRVGESTRDQFLQAVRIASARFNRTATTEPLKPTVSDYNLQSSDDGKPVFFLGQSPAESRVVLPSPNEPVSTRKNEHLDPPPPFNESPTIRKLNSDGL